METEVLALARHLEAGTSATSLVCPRCAGGAKKDKSFSVTRTSSKVLFKCHRATCGYRGVVQVTPSASTLDNKEGGKVPQSGNYIFRAPRDTTYRGPTEGLPPDIVETLSRRWSLSEWHLNRWSVRYINRGTFRGFCGRIALPVIDPETGTKAGLLVRSLDARDKPKTLLYSTCTSSLYTSTSSTSTLVLVEDVISSIRLSKHVHSLALLGTSLSTSKASIVQSLVTKLKINNIVLALDKDALHCSLVQVNKLKLVVQVPVQVVALDKDIKDLTEEELTQWLDSCGNS